MIKPFKFFEGELKILNHYNAPYIPLLRTPPGSYYDRTINPDLYGGVRLSELSDRVQQIARDTEFIPASYIQVPIPQQQRYDNKVITILRRRMNIGLWWRGYNQVLFDEPGSPLLSVLGGVNIGGMMHITYEITTHCTITERYRVSVPLVNLQRRG